MIKIWNAATGACVQTLKTNRATRRLLFDPTTNSLSTDTGLLNLDLTGLSCAIDDRLADTTLRGVQHFGWCIDTDGDWILKDGKGMLWLPPEHRVEESVVVGSMVAIGCRSGRVLVMKVTKSGQARSSL